MLITLLSLSDRFVQRNDKGVMDLIGLGQQKEPRDVVVLDFVIVLVTTHPQEPLVQLDAVPTTRCKERAFLVGEFNNDIASGLFDAGVLHDELLETLGVGRNTPVMIVEIGLGRDVEPNGDCGGSNERTYEGRTNAECASVETNHPTP